MYVGMHVVVSAKKTPAVNEGIKRCFCQMSVLHLIVAYIGPNSRTERLRKTKHT